MWGGYHKKGRAFIVFRIFCRSLYQPSKNLGLFLTVLMAELGAEGLFAPVPPGGIRLPQA
jgi:hypothetical protein